MAAKVVIAGASGVVGTSATEAFAGAGWEVVALSRRAPELSTTSAFHHLPVDLRDAGACEQALRGIPGVTHLVFAALMEKPGLIAGWSDPEQMELNLSLLRNCLSPLLSGGSLEHVSLMQGTKAYGLHLHPMPIPARERAPRDPHPNFYWLQEDFVRAQAGRHGFGFTILRPQMVVGAPYGVAMNTVPVLGAFAAICRETGQPFGFPGGASFVWEASDARLVANALVWAARADAARGQHFNITNGDVFEWRNLWPAIADAFGLAPAKDAALSMAEFLPAQSQVWDRIVAKHGLRRVSMAELLGESHHLADFCFAYGATQTPPPAFISAIKLRQAGFTQFVDSEEMFRHWIGHLIERRIVPPR